MRVLLLGSTPMTQPVADTIGLELVGQVVGPADSTWPEADLGVSAGYRHKVPAEVLERLPIVNLHTGYLPYNRGAYPNVWPILDGTPAGVTLHWMAPAIDAGDIIAREYVKVDPWDTAYTLYAKLQDRMVELFTHWWPAIRDGTAPRMPQTGKPYTEHRKRDLGDVTLDLDERMAVRDMLAVLRARSYPGYPGVTFTENGRSWEVVVSCRPVP